MQKKTAIIIGAGPAGLTAAFELLDKTDIKPIIFEMTDEIGGISKTVKYKGNRIDIGGHRFFSKSARIMKWWQNIFPLQGAPAIDDSILGRTVPLARVCHQRGLREQKARVVLPPDPEKTDKVMLVRSRLSRIYFLRRFFNYPITISLTTFHNLGLVRIIRIALSYLYVKLLPIRTEKSLEDFFINRFGSELYLTFFKDYTEKVWGVPCREIKPEWGAQRVKGLSVVKTLLHALKNLLIANNKDNPSQKTVETSLIEQFLYPKLGPGQIWEEVASIIAQNGGKIIQNFKVTGIKSAGEEIVSVTVKNVLTGEISCHAGDYFFSTMPVQELIEALGEGVPEPVSKVSTGLCYRDFMTVGLLLRKLKIKNISNQKTVNNIVPDNWIYIQERGVRLGRLQIFNNWSPYLVEDQDTVWIGLEYFCNEGDDLWIMPDEDFIRFASAELESIGIIDSDDVLDATVIRVPKAYPAYFGTYKDFHVIQEYTDRLANLFLIGRNGMHRYNNADHSMLTAIVAVENIISGRTDKSNLWKVNTEESYHE